MGIMRLMKTLIQRYPLIKKTIKFPSDIPPIDNLYFDLNGIIHEFCHSKNENILSLLKKKNDSDIYSEICELVNKLIKLINPQSLVMISLDGVAPIAKIYGQLCSRYIKGCEKSEEIQKFLNYLGFKEIHYFNQDQISPCTDFIINLEKYMVNYFEEEKRKNFDFWKDKKILFSTSNIPGEGEYKIMENIREEKQNENNGHNKKYCIISNDSDFILLSLFIHEPNILLLTRGDLNNYHYDINYNEKNNSIINEGIFISLLREYLENEFLELKANFDFNKERFYDDFAFLLFLLGNAFLPGVLFLDLNGEVFEKLLDSYKKYIKKNGDYITKNGMINFDNFIQFIIGLSLYEKDFIQLKYDNLKSNWDSKKYIYNSNKLIEIYNKEFNNDNNKNSDSNLQELMNSNKQFVEIIKNIIDQEVLLNDKEYKNSFENINFYKFKNAYNKNLYEGKKLYYANKFGISIEEGEGKQRLEKLILDYLLGLQWCLLYAKGFVNWNWNYHFKYAPLLSDIASIDFEENINEKINDNIINKVSEPLSPYIYQCLIFNNNSFDLIPQNYHQIKTIIKDYYNYEIDIDNNGFYFISQMIFRSFPILENEETISKIIEFDKKELKNTKNYKIIKDRTEYCFNINYNIKRKNEIFNEDYNIKNTDEMFPSIKNIKNNEIIEDNIDNNLKKEEKKIKMKKYSIKLQNNFGKKTKKEINEFLNDIFNAKIITYGYPFKKLGIVNSIYYNNREYLIDQETGNQCNKYYNGKYNETIIKDYKSIGIIIQDIFPLIEIIPIKKIDIDDSDIFIYDYDYKYLVPFQITSLNKDYIGHTSFLKEILENNNIKISNLNEINIYTDKEKILKEKDIFYFDENLKSNHKNEIKDNYNKNKKPHKGKKKKDNKKRLIKIDKMTKKERKAIKKRK